MKHRLDTILSAFSLLLFVATLATWVRSYWAYDDLEWDHSGPVNNVMMFRLYDVETNRGRLHLFFSQWEIPEVEGLGAFVPVFFREHHTGFKTYPAVTIIGEPFWRQFSFAYERNVFSKHLTIPLWLPAVLFGIYPAALFYAAFKKLRQQRRIASGLCSACGYDLRESRDRCPECGKVPTTLAVKAR